MNYISFKKGLVNILVSDLVSRQTASLIKNAIYYGSILTAIAVCFYLGYRRLVRTGYSKKTSALFSIITGVSAFPLGILSSRAANMFYSPPELWSLTEFFKQTFSGYTHTFHTCWVLPTIAIIITAKILKIRISEIFDIEFLYMPVGHAIGRVGCFLVGCCWGQKTTCHIGETTYKFYMPIPILAIINNLIIFFILRFLFTKIYESYESTEKSTRIRATFSGAVIAGYFLLYAPNRFLLEYIRTEKVVTIGLTQAQLAMILYIIAGLLFSLFVCFKYIKCKNKQI